MYLTFSNLGWAVSESDRRKWQQSFEVLQTLADLSHLVNVLYVTQYYG